ncbi:fatty acid hydroxylase domain-containing protein [Haematococcus lacustris]|uniref:Fatty acid hydroxylase domain-containing protein n=1 Tax=Haematococcus lacustris TaxID=44745 RepID=A0A6A0AG87_HAELA|nr:fatty acid hydroxylase domain-containing protein [Haematococcus lacustris]
MPEAQPVSWTRGWQITATLAVLYCTALSASLLLSPDEENVLPKLPASLEPLTRDVRAWLRSWAPLHDMPKAERLQLLLEENQWKNSLVMWMFPASVQDALPHFVQTWLRCWILCWAVYVVIGGLWCYYAYYCFGDKLFKPNTIPGMKDVLEQIKVSLNMTTGLHIKLSLLQPDVRAIHCDHKLGYLMVSQVSNVSMPLYSLLPALTEFMGEMGWTMAYPRVENVGLPMFVIYFALYICSVEFGVYWMHRGLHEIKWGYQYLHHIHHKYNKEHTLSPFAGLAFHPIDGMMQAIPYTWTLFFCPMHFLTHEMLLFATGIWTTNIHDCIHGKVTPVMGAGYHTIHHTTYKHNYGHYFTFPLPLAAKPADSSAAVMAVVSSISSAACAVSSPKGVATSDKLLDAAETVSAHKCGFIKAMLHLCRRPVLSVPYYPKPTPLALSRPLRLPLSC